MKFVILAERLEDAINKYLLPAAIRLAKKSYKNYDYNNKINQMELKR